MNLWASSAALWAFAGDQWRFFRRMRVLRRKEVATILGLSALAVVAEATGMAMVAPILAFIEKDKSAEAFAESSSLAGGLVSAFGGVGLPVTLATLSLVAFGFVLFRQIANYFNIVETERVKLSIGRRLTVLVFSKLMNSERRIIERQKPGESSLICDYECQAAAALVRVYATIWGVTLSFLAYGAILVVAAPAASLTAAIVLGLVMLALARLIRRTRSLSEEGVAVRKEQVDFFTERFRAWRLIKLSDAQQAEAEEANAIAAKVAENRVELTRVGAKLTLYFAPIAVGTLLVILYLFVDVLQLDISVILLFALVMLRLIPLAQSYQKQISLLAQFEPSMKRLDKIMLDAERAAERLDSGLDFAPPISAIELQDVSYAYEGEDAPIVLDRVTARIPAGAVTALIGPSGAGKSTLIDLLGRICEPASGRILVDGAPLEDFSIRSLRAAIAFVPQEPFIFDASVAENIRYQAVDASDAEIEEAARLACADEFIRELPAGYDEPLGDGGGRLSGGQRQRIALARAFATKAPILILDEPTSALDGGSEAAIQESIERIVRERAVTALVIAHRLTTIENADHVIQLESGRVAAEGSVAEVLGDVRRRDVPLKEVQA